MEAEIGLMLRWDCVILVQGLNLFGFEGHGRYFSNLESHFTAQINSILVFVGGSCAIHKSIIETKRMRVGFENVRGCGATQGTLLAETPLEPGMSR